MKTRKFTKVISFIVAFSIVLGSTVLTSIKSNAAVTPVETQCVRCNETLEWSGPFLGSVPTPDDCTLEGAYIASSNRDEYHYYIIKCPDYRVTLIGTGHDNYPASEKHNYTQTYTPYDNINHTTTYTCTSNNAAYNIVGTAGCGYSKNVLEEHYVNYGTTVSISDTQHKINNHCICGEILSSYTYSHSFSYGKWTDNSNGTCSRTKSCSSCGYNGIETKSHSNTNGQWEYYFTEVDTDYSYQEYHKRDTTCSNCGSTGMDFELHTFTEFSDWSSYSDTRHKRSKYCTVCNYTVNHTDYHHFLESDYIYEDNGDGTHTVIKPCAECGYTTTETVEHNHITGEWFKYGTENPYDDEYYHTEYHQRDNVCSECGNVISEHAEHEWYWETETWVYQSETRHTRTKRCKDCGYGWIYGDYHHFTTSPYYEQHSEDEHTKINPCDECDYEKETLEAHSFTASTVYTQFSESQHQVTQSCICGEKHISYADHVDKNSDCYCDKCGYLMTKFSVTVPTTMALTMGTDGEVYAPSDVVIVNNSTAAVLVKKADINSRNGWNIVPYSTNMANEKVDSKKIGFKMNGIQTDSVGTTESLSYNDSWIIEKDKSSSVVYDAVVSATSTPIDEQVIEIVYIVDWKTNY